MSYTCPQCGNETETLHEGYCQECCESNQIALDEHNAAFLAWEQMTDPERDEWIRDANNRA